MSSWTYVQGLIELDVPGRTQVEKRYSTYYPFGYAEKTTTTFDNL